MIVFFMLPIYEMVDMMSRLLPGDFLRKGGPVCPEARERRAKAGMARIWPGMFWAPCSRLSAIHHGALAAFIVRHLVCRRCFGRAHNLLLKA
ncbi:hypothetical protein FVW27_10710 [Desulfovibrio sp. XJ01]|nr:hypothetical protein [Nitratidesulfovibrio liaohensis]